MNVNERLMQLTHDEALRALQELAGISPAMEQVVNRATGKQISLRPTPSGASLAGCTRFDQAMRAAAEPSGDSGSVSYFDRAMAATVTPPAVGKDKAWAQMSQSEAAAAAVLGYDELTWDQGEVSEVCLKHWVTLQPHEIRAAEELGYTRGEWDAELPEPAAVPVEISPHISVSPEAVKAALAAQAVQDVQASENAAQPSATWAQMNEAQRKAATVLG